MKKVLFATTALVAFAGAAAAEVTLTGNAEMGIQDNDDYVADGTGGFDTEGEVGFHTDIDVTFTMSGETDGGLAFGATIDLDESDDGDAFASDTQGGETIFISGGFGTLTMGDTDGALDWALTEVLFNSGSLGDNEETLGYNGNSGLDGLYDGQILRYDYAFGDFGFALSAELDDTDGDDGDILDGLDGDAVIGIGAQYSFDFGGGSMDVGAGYQFGEVENTDVDTWGLSLAGTFANGFSAGISYMSFENHLPDLNDSLADALGGPGGRTLTPGFDTDHFGIGVGYTTGAISVSANYGQFDHDAGVEVDGFGVTAGYDLGGGAIVQAGYGISSIDIDGGPDFEDLETWSLGIRMNF